MWVRLYSIMNEPRGALYLVCYRTQERRGVGDPDIPLLYSYSSSALRSGKHGKRLQTPERRPLSPFLTDLIPGIRSIVDDEDHKGSSLVVISPEIIKTMSPVHPVACYPSERPPHSLAENSSRLCDMTCVWEISRAEVTIPDLLVSDRGSKDRERSEVRPRQVEDRFISCSVRGLGDRSGLALEIEKV
jgi:hypothetical protein